MHFRNEPACLLSPNESSETNTFNSSYYCNAFHFNATECFNTSFPTLKRLLKAPFGEKEKKQPQTDEERKNTPSMCKTRHFTSRGTVVVALYKAWIKPTSPNRPSL